MPTYPTVKCPECDEPARFIYYRASFDFHKCPNSHVCKHRRSTGEVIVCGPSSAWQRGLSDSYEEEQERIKELIKPLLEEDPNAIYPAMLGVVLPAVSYALRTLPDQLQTRLLGESRDYIESREIGGHPVTRQYGKVAKKILVLMGELSLKPPSIAPDDVKPMP